MNFDCIDSKLNKGFFLNERAWVGADFIDREGNKYRIIYTINHLTCWRSIWHIASCCFRSYPAANAMSAIDVHKCECNESKLIIYMASLVSVDSLTLVLYINLSSIDKEAQTLCVQTKCSLLLWTIIFSKKLLWIIKINNLWRDSSLERNKVDPCYYRLVLWDCRCKVDFQVPSGLTKSQILKHTWVKLDYDYGTCACCHIDKTHTETSSMREREGELEDSEGGKKRLLWSTRERGGRVRGREVKNGATDIWSDLASSVFEWLLCEMSTSPASWNRKLLKIRYCKCEMLTISNDTSY